MDELERVLETARRELGVKESPAGSNRVKYNTAYYGREAQGGAYPWCCVFLWWCFRQAGAERLFYGGGKTASCGALADWAKRTGRLVREGYRAGDLVFLRFSGPVIQHIGLVERVNADGSLTTIEGNTGTGSDADGGQVQRRRRPARYAAGAFRPEYEEEAMTQTDFDRMMEVWLAKRAQAQPGEFSRQARTWAEENGIVRGDGGGGFQYKSWCTREQMLVFLHRFAQMLSR